MRLGEGYPAALPAYLTSPLLMVLLLPHLFWDPLPIPHTLNILLTVLGAQEGSARAINHH